MPRLAIQNFIAQHWWRIPEHLSPWDERLAPLLERLVAQAGPDIIEVLSELLDTPHGSAREPLERVANQALASMAPDDARAIRDILLAEREKGQNQPARPRGVQPLRFRRRRARRRRLMQVGGNNEEAGGPPLSDEQITAALEAIARHAKDVGAKWALVGGTALLRYGSPRHTYDIDIIADRPFDLEPHHTLAIGGHAYEIETDTGLMDVDVIIREDDYRPLYVEALRKARLDSAGVPVITPEYMVAMKMAAGRGKDEDDVLWLIKAGKVDVPVTRKIVGRLVGGQFAQREFDSLVMEATWRAQEEQPRDY